VDATPPKLRKPVQPGISPRPGGSRAGSADAAFDIWLQRGLRDVYGEVAEEPIPPEVLALIENSRNA